EPGRDVIRTGRAAAPRRMLEERAPGEQRAGGEERQRETSGDVRAWRLVGLAELPGVPDDHGERSEPEREAEELEPDAVRIEGEEHPPVGHAVGGRAHARSLGPCGWR